MKKTLLITGAAGFIGFNLIKKIINKYQIIGLDNINNYYDINLKKERLKLLQENDNFKFIQCDISNKEKINDIFKNNKIDIVINLAAQAGVRYSIENPDVYIEANIIGFYNILECCRNNNIKKLLFASSSSVYGENKDVPFKIESDTNHPSSLYAATKKSNELLAYTYSSLFNINCIGLRFFSVYGPFGRPDMAYYSFTEKLINNEKIKLYNYGNCKRDFTYIDDVVESLEKILEKDFPKYKIYNVGNQNPIKMIDFIEILKDELINNNLLPKNFNLNSHIEMLPMQKGDVTETYSDTTEFEKDYNYSPKTSIKEGIKRFIEWYKEYKH